MKRENIFFGDEQRVSNGYIEVKGDNITVKVIFRPRGEMHKAKEAGQVMIEMLKRYLASQGYRFVPGGPRAGPRYGVGRMRKERLSKKLNVK